MKENLKRVFEIEPNELELSYNDVGIGSVEDFEDMQLGYRVDGDGNKIKDWFGDEYYVVGFESACGDPIIVKSDEKELPIYFMIHDDWDSIEKIANSVEDFSLILKMIQERDLQDEKEAQKLIKEIKKIAPKGCTYWEILIQGENEILNEE